jgi:hypothetical protein
VLTAFDKAIVPVAVAAAAWLNQKYGFHLDATPEGMTALIGGISAIIVYFVPNKVA